MGLSIAEAGAGIATSVDLNELKQHLQMNLSKTNNDDELLRFLRAAETAIGHRTGPLIPTQVTEKHNGGTTCIVLRRPRAISLTSVAYADGTIGTLSDYDLDGDTGILYWAYGTTGQFTNGGRYVNVTYTAGWTDVPADLKQAVKELVAHLWTSQRGGASSTRPGFPGTEDEPITVGPYTSWPAHVQELVQPYTIPAVA